MGRPSHTGDTQQMAPENVPKSDPTSAGTCLSACATLYGRWLHTVCPRCTLPLHAEGSTSLTVNITAGQCFAGAPSHQLTSCTWGRRVAAGYSLSGL